MEGKANDDDDDFRKLFIKNYPMPTKAAEADLSDISDRVSGNICSYFNRPT